MPMSVCPRCQEPKGPSDEERHMAADFSFIKTSSDNGNLRSQLQPSWMAKYRICLVLPQCARKEHFPLSRGWTLTSAKTLWSIWIFKTTEFTFRNAVLCGLCYIFLIASESCFQLSFSQVWHWQSLPKKQEMPCWRSELKSFRAVHNSKRKATRNEKRQRVSRSKGFWREPQDLKCPSHSCIVRKGNFQIAKILQGEGKNPFSMSIIGRPVQRMTTETWIGSWS